MSIESQLRRVTDDAISSGKFTRYSVAIGAKVEHATLKRWLDENADIRLSTVNKLAAFFGLELRPADALKAKDKVKAPAPPAVDWTKTEPKKKPRDEGRERRK